MQRMENIDKCQEIPPKYSEHVFPMILDEFWDGVGGVNKKGFGKKKRAVKKS